MPGTGTGSNGSTASRTPMTAKKRSPMARVFRSASRENSRTVAWAAFSHQVGASTASDTNANATASRVQNSPGNCSIVSLLERFISGKVFASKRQREAPNCYRITDFRDGGLVLTCLALRLDLRRSAGAGGRCAGGSEKIGPLQALVSG